MNNEKIKYIGFGSPLMDMIADVNDELIEKYKVLKFLGII